MGIESPIAGIEDLNTAWPLDSDLQTGPDDHLRLIKEAVTDTFAELASTGGVVNANATELNYLQGVTSAIQTQLDAKTERAWRVEPDATDSPAAGDKILADPPTGGQTFTLPDTPTEGSEIQIIDISGLAEAPNNTITVNRDGTNTINNLDTQTSGLTTFDFQNDGEQWVLAYSSTVWYAWTIDGLN